MTKTDFGSGESRSQSSSFHPAFAVSNIKNAIHMVLDQEESHYAAWVEYFQIHVCAYNVLDHIDDSVPAPTDIDAPTWKRLDAIVKQWIYGTISRDLAQTIMKPGATAVELWKRLEEIFYDNKHTRAVYLEEQFNSTRLDSFSNMTDYCKQLKLLADQLANVDNPISEKKMVLQLISGLPKGEYDTLATLIQQSDPLPSFTQARSRLLLEETRRAKQDEHAETALLIANNSTNVPPTNAPSPPTHQPTSSRGGHTSRGAGRNGNRGRGNWRGGKGRNRNGRSNGQPTQQQFVQQPYHYNPQPWPVSPTWATAPCPYPSAGPSMPRPQSSTTHQTQQRSQAGLLGPIPQSSPQAYLTQQDYGQPMALTDLGTAFNTMQIQPPHEPWLMDTGASSHLTKNSGPTYGEYSYEMQ